MIGAPHTVLFVIIISFIVTFTMYVYPCIIFSLWPDPCGNARKLVRPVHTGGSHTEDSQRMGREARWCI